MSPSVDLSAHALADLSTRASRPLFVPVATILYCLYYTIVIVIYYYNIL